MYIWYIKYIRYNAYIYNIHIYIYIYIQAFCDELFLLFLVFKICRLGSSFLHT